jgi:tetratricopeptide (TPR) repeat protein
MGIAQFYIGNFDGAIANYQTALEINPRFVEALNNMGIALKDKGSLDLAIESFEKAIQINPNFFEAHRNLSSLITYQPEDDKIFRLKGLFSDKTISDRDRCELCFCLAKGSEDVGKLKESFEYLQKGNALRKEILSYKISVDEKLFTNLKNTDFQNPVTDIISDSKFSGVLPIFILGMPRSGTTLVEQIISSHSEVTGAGELNFIKRFGLQIATGKHEMSLANILRFRKMFLKEIIQISNGKKYLTDKMPLNFRFIGLICRAFPEAKILHVKRNASAICWSNFKSLFASESIGYCYNIDDLLKYYGLYQELMQFWNERYADRIYEVDYDKLVLSQEKETKKMVRYLGLNWQKSLLFPEKNNRSVRTASQQQVRQKVYKGSSQQWRKFEPYLDGVFDGLN